MPKHDCILVGPACCDLIFSGLPSMPRMGEEIWAERFDITVGGMMNSAVAMSRLGLNVGLAAEIGNDTWGDVIAAKMREEGIDTSFVLQYAEPYPQVTVALNFRKDRSFISFADGKNKPLFMRHLYGVVRNSDAQLYHFSAQREYADLIAEAKKRKRLVSLDASWDERWLQSAELKRLVSLADIFMPNLKEAQTITGKQDPYDAIDELAKTVPVVVIKMGERGAIAKAGGAVYTAEAIAAKPVDATGAGDCFVAGFIYGWLRRKRMEDCLKIANYCGGKCVESVGGYAGAPRLWELLRDLDMADSPGKGMRADGPSKSGV